MVCRCISCVCVCVCVSLVGVQFFLVSLVLVRVCVRFPVEHSAPRERERERCACVCCRKSVIRSVQESRGNVTFGISAGQQRPIVIRTVTLAAALVSSSTTTTTTTARLSHSHTHSLSSEMLRRCLQRRCIVRSVTKDNYTLSQLSNGLRVLTCDDGNGITGMGLFMLNGTKFEDETNAGSAAVFESLPLRSNMIFSSREISQAIGTLGNAFKVTNNREAMSVVLMTPRYHRKDALELLNAMCLHPTQDEEEFRIAKEKAYERTLVYSRDATSMCFELVHEAGWNGKGVGRPLNPTKQTLDNLTREKFTAFHQACTRPERTVVAATGIADHELFAIEAERILKFGDAPAMPPRLAVSADHPYTGGSRLVQQTEAPESMNKFQEKNLSHVALFYQGIPINHPDYYTVSVIQTLLGGGTSFSSGGPGKGMYTKLFREVLNKAGFLHGLECITAWYSDGGLIGLYGSAPHNSVHALLEVMIYQAATICQRVSPAHLEMAKNQLRSQLILLGEGREQLLSDMGFNMLLHNHVITASETAEGTRHITLDGLKRVCSEMVRKPLTFAIYGETTKMPSHQRLEELLRRTYDKLN